MRDIREVTGDFNSLLYNLTPVDGRVVVERSVPFDDGRTRLPNGGTPYDAIDRRTWEDGQELLTVTAKPYDQSSLSNFYPVRSVGRGEHDPWGSVHDISILTSDAGVQIGVRGARGGASQAQRSSNITLGNDGSVEIVDRHSNAESSRAPREEIFTVRRASDGVWRDGGTGKKIEVDQALKLEEDVSRTIGLLCALASRDRSGDPIAEKP